MAIGQGPKMLVFQLYNICTGKIPGKEQISEVAFVNSEKAFHRVLQEVKSGGSGHWDILRYLGVDGLEQGDKSNVM